MYKLYRKVEKSEANEHGLEMLGEVNPFEQPTFLSLLALNNRKRDVNGSISRILELSGVRLPNGEDYLPANDLAINFLGLSYIEPEGDFFLKVATRDNPKNIDNDTREFVIKYILPLISNNGVKRDIDECLRNMRNINIMCYCDAIFMIASMNDVLIEEMKKMNFTEEEIDNILSQVCIIPIGTEYTAMKYAIPKLKFSTIFLIDILDTFGEIEETALNNIFKGNIEALFDSSYVIDLPDGECKNSKTLVVNSDGEHDLKKFISKGIAFPAIIIKTISAILNNSVTNAKREGEFIPLQTITEKELEQICNQLISQKGISRDELTISTLQDVKYPLKSELSLESEGQGMKQ